MSLYSVLTFWTPQSIRGLFTPCWVDWAAARSYIQDHAEFKQQQVRSFYTVMCTYSFYPIISVTLLQVNNYQEQRTIYDVIATIYGSVEPGEWVAHTLSIFVCRFSLTLICDCTCAVSPCIWWLSFHFIQTVKWSWVTIEMPGCLGQWTPTLPLQFSWKWPEISTPWDKTVRTTYFSYCSVPSLMIEGYTSDVHIHDIQWRTTYIKT